MANLMRMEKAMSLILTTGMIISLIFVTIGGGLYLYQSGYENAAQVFHSGVNFQTTVEQIFISAFSFSPFGIIELGVLMLVATQSVRVGLLVWYYAMKKDRAFTGISLFILAVLIYSFFFRH